MSGGSRSKTGCLTCRLRKKKCDEQRPVCQACRRSQLACYGYDTPVPAWIRNKSTWAEVRQSVEAQNISNLAESNYKVSRKVRSEREPGPASGVSQDIGHGFGVHNPASGTILPWSPTSKLLAHLGVTRMSNIWQLQTDTIWWDSRIGSLGAADDSSAQQETRLLMIFLQVVHEITHSFYKLSSNSDRSWLLNRIVKSRALYYAALSTSACFEHSLTQPTTIDEIGICPRVRSFQSLSVHKLRAEVESYSASRDLRCEELILDGIRLVDVILNLLNLETFSMFGGCWEMHHRAARAIFHHIEISIRSRADDTKVSPIQSILRDLPGDDERRRTLEFCVTNFVWIDVVATTTFGLSAYDVCDFNYLPLLDAGDIRPQDVMGCSILGTLAAINKFEQWCENFAGRSLDSESAPDTVSRYQNLAIHLEAEIGRLQVSNSSLAVSEAYDLASDIKLISIIWAYAARVHLEAIICRFGIFSSDFLQRFVESCLQKLEKLPTRLCIRVCWPYTIAGSLSVDENQQIRFREILAKILRERQAPGLCWKGLIVMEECWRLRATQDGMTIGLREAMSSLNTKVLLV